MGVGLAHAADLPHQTDGVRIGGGDGVGVDHRQGEAGALQQPAEAADIGEGGNAGADAAMNLEFRLHPGAAKLVERARAQHHAEEQPVRLERAVDLDKRAGKVIDPMERQQAHHEIEALFGEG